VSNDNTKAIETEYKRIKILNDDGKKFADIEIPYVDRSARIEDIQARTIRPDGTSVTFQGQVFDRTAVKARRTKVQVKAFTLPEVQKGSIIEYSYTVRFHDKAPDVLKNRQDYVVRETLAIPSATWLIQDDLFTRRGRFSVRPLPGSPLQWMLKNVPGNFKPQTQADGTVVLEVENIPAFEREAAMPPENWVKSRVVFFYLLGPLMAKSYWRTLGEERAKALAPYLGDPRKLKPIVAGIVSAGDSPEAQLRKLYARVQKIRYLSYEPSKTSQEAKRENLKENKNVEDVLKHDYAYANEINLVLVALARAAGFEAALVRVKSRDSDFFIPEIPDPDQFNSVIVWVLAGGKQYFLDPATLYCPFDLLPWAEGASTGILLPDIPVSVRPPQGSKTFVDLVATPAPSSGMAVTGRKATLAIDGEGGVDGTVTVTFAGQEALERRIAARNMDETARRKALEQEVKDWAPAAATVELTGVVNWEETDQPLHAAFSIKVPDYAAATGRRMLFRAGFFEGNSKWFLSATRIHDIYFAYPFEEADDITWKLPPGFQVSGLPEKKETPSNVGTYGLMVEKTESGLHSARLFTVNGIYLEKAYYPTIRGHFNVMRVGDESQVVLERSGAQDASKTN
jgi:hypothetical protein